MGKIITIGAMAVFLSGMAVQAVNVNWEFNTPGNTEGWVAANDGHNSLSNGIIVTHAVTGSEGVLTTSDVTGIDPNLVNNTSYSAGGEYWSSVEIRARQLDGNGGNPMAWSADGTVLIINGAVLSSDVGGAAWDTTTEAGEWMVTTLSLPTVGMNDITNLRFDPVGNDDSKIFEVDYIRLATRATPPPIPELGFEFNTLGDPEGWSGDQIVELWVTNAVRGSDVVLTASDITGGDSKLNMGGALLPDGYWKSIEMRVRKLDGNGGNPIPWTPVGTLLYPNAQIKSKSIGGDGWATTHEAGEWIITSFDLSYLMSSPLNTLRIDLTSNAAENFEIDYIRFATRQTPPLPATPSKLVHVFEFNTLEDMDHFICTNATGLTVANAIDGSEVVLTSGDLTSAEPQLRYNQGGDSAFSFSAPGPWARMEIRIRQLDGNPGDAGVSSQPWNPDGTLLYMNPWVFGSMDLGAIDAANPNCSVVNEANHWIIASYDLSYLDHIEMVKFYLNPVGDSAEANFEIDWIKLYAEGVVFDAWALSYGLSGTNATELEDPDNDTYNNLYEYAFGGDPLNSNVYGVVTTEAVQDGGTPYFEYVHARRTGLNTGVEYNLLQKDDLMTNSWIDLGDSAIVGVVEYGDDYELVTNRVKAAGSKTFLNLEVAENGTTRYAGSPDRLTVALIGDPQYGFPSGTDPQPALDTARLTFEDLKTVPHDFFVVLGDLIQPNNNFWYYHHEYTVGMATRPLYFINGNASFYLGSEVYTEETGISLDPYKVVERGIRFIFLHTTGVQTPAGYDPPNDNHQCAVGEKAMDWLEEELAADTNSTTVIFFHAPLLETTYDSTERMCMVESAAMKILLGTHPNVKIIANGHTHYPYGATDGSGRGGYKMEGDLLNVAVGRPPNTMFFNIEEDQIEIRIRDNQNQQWHTQFGYVYDVETTLQPIENE